MKKAWLGIGLGSIVYFVVSVLLWMVVPWHDAVMKKLPEETLIRDTLKVVVPDAGFYFFPSQKTENGRMDPQQYDERFRNGPAGFLMFSPGGTSPIRPRHFVVEFVVALVTAAFGMGLLILVRGTLRSYRDRLLVVLGTGVFVWFNSHLPYGNWFFFPTPYLFVKLADTVLCFGLMGLVLAKFVPESTRSGRDSMPGGLSAGGGV